MNTMSSNHLSLAQQIALLEETAPVDLDPEDAHTREIDTQDISSVDPSAREHYVDVGPSTLRKHNDSVLDPKYNGVKRTRKQILEEEEAEEAEEDGMASDMTEDSTPGDGNTDSYRESDGVEGENEYGGEGGDDVSSRSEQKSQPDREVSKRSTDEQKPVDPSSALRKARSEDQKKGRAVSRQIALWDSLLDARIRLQKVATAANRLPTTLELEEYAMIPECQESMNKMLHEATMLSDEIFELQEYLLTSNESITVPSRKRRKVQAEGVIIDYTARLQDATKDIFALEETYHPYLVQTLSKWSSKIQAVAPSVLLPSNRNAFSSRNSYHTKSIMQLIDETLADHDKLIARTQIRKGKGAKTDDIVDEQFTKVDPEIFDDTDFYQQLLRDIIDGKGNAVGGADDWISTQKQKRAKKRVDTKASKGRKLRYEPHEKLQNFMVPVPAIDSWHEEQIDELFASLLGRGFENSMGQADANGGVAENEHQLDEQLDKALRSGFKVFG